MLYVDRDNGYISVLSRLGLWLQQDDLVRLTSEGTAVVSKADSAPAEARRMVIEIKYRDFMGYDALFKLLRQGSQSLDDIHEHLKEALGVDWESKNQSSSVRRWLVRCPFRPRRPASSPARSPAARPPSGTPR